MQLGLGVLGLSPAAFWALTPRELEAALRGRGLMGDDGGATPNRGDLASLMQRFPDPHSMRSST